MIDQLLIRLGILALLFAAAMLFFLRPRLGGGKGGAKGNRFHSSHVYGGNPSSLDGPGSHGHSGDGHGAGGGGD